MPPWEATFGAAEGAAGATTGGAGGPEATGMVAGAAEVSSDISAKKDDQLLTFS